MPISEDLVTPIPGIENLTYEDANTLLNIQRLWLEATQLTRNFFQKAVKNNPEQSAEGTRLFLQLPTDIYNEFKKYYIEADSHQFMNMISRMISGYWQIVTSYKNSDTAAINASTAQWHQTANELAAFLASINKHYDEIQLKILLNDYISLWIKEIIALLNNDYELENKIYEEIQDVAVHIASIIAMGIIAMRHTSKLNWC